MRSINRTFITGNVVREPEKKATRGGLSVLEFSVAVNSSKRLEDGSYEDRASFVPVKVFGGQADFLGDKLAKGMRVFVSGRLEQRRWEDKDGRRHSMMEVIAEDVEFPRAAQATQPVSAEGSAYDDEIPF